MNAMPDVRSHSHADGLLNDYIMGTLPAADQDWLDQHIATCIICQAEIPLLLEASFALPFAVDEPPVEMSDDLWDRIAQSIEPDLRENMTMVVAQVPYSVDATTTDPTSTWPAQTNRQPFVPLDLSGPDPSRRRSSRVTSINAYKWFALAAAAVLILSLSAILARTLLWPQDSASPPQTIAMVDANGNPIGSDVASLQYLPDAGTLVLDMVDMPPAPVGQIYQAWLIVGDVPVPIGTVDPSSGDFEHEATLAEFDAFAITVEPGPDGSLLPTSNPIVVAPLVPAT